LYKSDFFKEEEKNFLLKYGVKCMFLHLWSALFRRAIEKYGVKCMFQKRSAFGIRVLYSYPRITNYSSLYALKKNAFYSKYLRFFDFVGV
jgi:hypothetical protein